MTPKEFSSKIHSEVVCENMEIYRDIFLNTHAATDPYWGRALLLFDSLSSDQKSVLFEVIRQVSVDSISNVLGIIDGVNSLGSAGVRFELKCGDEKPINGDLQGIFLAIEERYRDQ